MQQPGLLTQMKISELCFCFPLLLQLYLVFTVTLWVALPLCDISLGMPRLDQPAMAGEVPPSPESLLINPPQD